VDLLVRAMTSPSGSLSLMPKELEFKSETIPGASFALLPMGRNFRHRMEVQLSEVRYRTRLLLDQYRTIVLDAEGREKLERPLTPEQLGTWRETHSQDPSLELLTPEDRQKLTRIDVESGLSNQELRLAVANARLLRFALPGEEYADIKTKEDLFEFGPELFAREIEAKAEEGWILEEAIKKSSGQPPFSTQPEDGQTKTTSAEPASETSATLPAIAS
jgi:hypothetical protein